MTVRKFNGKAPVIADSAYVDEHAVVIGDVVIGEDSSLWPMAVARGDVNSISIGKSSNIQDGCLLHATHDGVFSPGGFPLVIGDGVTVGHGAILHACSVGDYCLIGTAATVMDGAVLGDYSLSAAYPAGGSINTSTAPTRYLSAAYPAGGDMERIFHDKLPLSAAYPAGGE